MPSGELPFLGRCAPLGTADPTARTLTAEAGPAVIWAFMFDDVQHLSDIVLYAGNLMEYTPYRLRFAAGLDCVHFWHGLNFY